MTRLLISTGEVSGDLQGSLLIQALHQEAAERGLDLEIVALGGDRMRRAGAKLLADTASLGAIGLWEAVPLIWPTLRLQHRLRQWLRLHPLDGVVLIDYMGANVNLGLRLKRDRPQVPITYYIAPQEWAFRLGDGGTTRLIGFSDRILAIFPEEARFYAEHGARVTWVGHPLLDTLGSQPGRAEARRLLGLAETVPVLLLLPASRRQELRYLLPEMAAAAAELQRRHPDLQVLVSTGLPGFEPLLEEACRIEGLRARVIPACEADALKPALCAAADLALTKSGTANLELALRGVPQVVVYRVSRVTAAVAKHLLRFNVPHISPVNLVLQERLVPELLQEDFSCDALIREAEILLDPDSEARQRLLEGYGRLRRTLGEPGVTRRAAVAILDQIPQGSPPLPVSA
ncbi:lipid-A-disaccharide synthase [Synechococcus sp. CBW1002]|jgi:lipid-A-disaccharide synthase|uniref:lipid-A-disaccharide synthase n=1 Tax=Synechococcus sp. CBW1002 TaxID=1353134 RepID=UPI0018CCC2B1|nr:lipid-A-disaccharide synthase [Synechococcus sp. CBW1002]QPN60054.1 lipid-A-disaccharide synthase [Synechococcus sp. CBW1002]